MTRATIMLFMAVVGMVMMSAVTGASIRLSPDSTTVLTHSRGYQPPELPEDYIDYTMRQIELIESGSQEHDYVPMDGVSQLPYCAPCQAYIQFGEWAVQSNATMTLIEAFLEDDVCPKITPNSTKCPKLVEKLVTLVEKIPGAMKHIGLYEPIRACSFLGLCSVDCCSGNPEQPQQITLGFGRNASEMHVSWVNGLNGDLAPTVFYGTDPENLNQSSWGYNFTYTDGGWLGQINRAVMTGLLPSTTYFYSVGVAMVSMYNFTTIDADALQTPYTIAVVGDMGANDNVWSPNNIAFLNGEVAQGTYQQVIHIGDISYADGYMASWDLFFNELQPTMTQVPYQVIPGNHELLFNFTAYQSRFFTSGLGAEIEPTQQDMADGLSGTNLWSSYDVGCVHFIALCSEDNFNTAWIGDNQLAWLQGDLERTKQRMIAAAAEDRDDATCSVSAPTFLVVYLHRPLYCSDDDADNCGSGPEAVYLRSKVENLFLQYGVDLVMYGHMHNMERSVPTYQSVPNPAGPIYVTNGAGGNREGIEQNWIPTTPVWSAIQASVTGVGELSILNSTTLEWSFLAQQNSSSGLVWQQIDQVYLQARSRTQESYLEREKIVAAASSASDSTEEAEAAEATESLPHIKPTQFIPISDPSWFFSPYNWNFQTQFQPTQSLWAQSNNPGAYIKLSFTGSSFILALNMTNTPDTDFLTVRWSVDDGAWQSAVLPSDLVQGNQIVMAQGLSTGKHSLLIFLLNSIQYGSVGDRWNVPTTVLRVSGCYVDSGAFLAPYPNVYTSNLLIYWDSIGEGVMVNGHSGADNDLTDNNSIDSWIQVLAAALRSEVGSVSFGGQGYIQTGSSHPLMHPNDTAAEHAWNHYSKGQSRLDSNGQLYPIPDYVFCGHGTNDAQLDPNLVQQAAFAWLQAIRAAISNGTYVFLTVPFGQFQTTALQRAFVAFNNEFSYPYTYLLDLQGYGAQEGLNGCGHPNRLSPDCVHPLLPAAERLGGMLANEAQQLMAGEGNAQSMKQKQPRQQQEKKNNKHKIVLTE